VSDAGSSGRGCAWSATAGRRDAAPGIAVPEWIAVHSAESPSGVSDAVAPEVVEDLAGGVMVPAVDRQAEAHVAGA
jgi:hypothetical protein